MLTYVNIRHFKSLRDVGVQLRPFTVLVGPNACGKSSVLQAIGYLCSMRDTAPQEIFIDNAALEHLYTRLPDGIDDIDQLFGNDQMSIQVGTDRLEYDFRVSWQASRSWIFGGAEQPILDYGVDTANQICDLWSHSMGTAGLPGDIIACIPRTRSVHFAFDRLAAPAVLTSSPPQLASDGSGLAAVLAHLALEYPTHFARIKDAAASVIGSLRDIRIRPVSVRTREAPDFRDVRDAVIRRTSLHQSFEGRSMEKPGYELIFDTTGGAGIPAHAMSDGTLRLLGVLTLTAGRDRPGLLLLDDIERGMHPRAQYELIQLLRRALKRDEQMQIIATTHSADLLDYLEPEEIRLLWLDETGATCCQAMTEHRQYQQWHELMTPSEVWGAIDREQSDPPGEASKSDES